MSEQHTEMAPAQPSSEQASQEMLSIRGLVTSYGQIEVLHDVDIHINSGEIVSLVGANGAGKSTLLMTISGLQPTDRGAVSFEGKDLAKIASDQRVAAGIVQVPEGRQVFKDLSVHAFRWPTTDACHGARTDGQAKTAASGRAQHGPCTVDHRRDFQHR